MKQNDRKNSQKEESPYVEKLINIRRVNKVVKGGKRLAFRSFVIVGDLDGKVGIGLGKSQEVPISIRKAMEDGKKKLQSVQIIDGTIPHEVIGCFGASRVVLKPAKPGTGVIAGGAIRILLEAAGIRDIVSKSIGAGNSLNAARAALSGLINLKVYDVECKRRGKKLPVYAKQNSK